MGKGLSVFVPALSGKTAITVSDLQGRLLASADVSNGNEWFALPPRQVSGRTYIVCITNNGNTVFVKKITGAW
jgi:hypothetical protein